MNPKARYLLVGVFAVVEALALMIAVPIIVLAIIAYVLLVCARVASSGIREASPRKHASVGGHYDSAATARS